MSDTPPLRLIVLHRGEPPNLRPDPWSGVGRPRIVALARAIAESEGWEARSPVTLVVRAEPEPVIAALGRFDEGAERWLAGAARQLKVTLPHLALLDHAAVETACRRLAGALVTRLGLESLCRYRYAAPPRGGLIVLGMLAYILDLPRDRLLPSRFTCDDTPLVVVDDIAISGKRMTEFLAQTEAPEYVIATLHSHPALRSAFCERNPLVSTFESAYDLSDLAPSLFGDDYPGWVARWQEREGDSVVWIGQPERVVYPWNEPDAGMWDAATQRYESGWTVVPAERCLKRRTRMPAMVQLMPHAPGPLRPHRDVVYGDVDDRLVVGHLGTGATFELGGAGRAIWQALVATGDVNAITTRIVEADSRNLPGIATDVRAFVRDLSAAGLLEDVTA